MKKFINKLIFITIVFIVVIIILIWQTSKSYTNSVYFVQIPLNELRTCPLNYLAVQGLHIIGIVAFDEELNVCISDGYKKFFFNQEGKLEKVWFSKERESLIAISPDGSLWAAVHLVYPPNSSYDQAIFASDCIRKYNSQGKRIFQFGEPEPTLWLKRVKFNQYRKALNFLKKRYNHLFGRSYQFGPSQIFGLWVDYKARLYVLTEYPSLHIFDANGKSLLVFNFEPDVNFEKERRDIKGRVNFVDTNGYIYIHVLETKRLRKLHLKWKGWTKLPWEWAEEDVYKGWIEVWQWEPKVQKIKRLPAIESGCVIGVDKRGNIYWMNYPEEAVYQISPDGKVQKIFEPYRFYRKKMIREWEKVFSKDPVKRKRLEAERWKFIEGLEHSIPRPEREIKLYRRDLYAYAVRHGDGPKIGHIAYVDKEGNLYITLITATHFRIDKIERASRWGRWRR